MRHNNKYYAARFYFLVIIILLSFSSLIWRLIQLNIIDRPFLQQQSNARTVRMINIQANRGMIMDRNGMPLAISTPVDSVWVNPKMFAPTPSQLTTIAKLLNISVENLQKKLIQKKKFWFIYLKRHIAPQVSDKIKAMSIEGLYLQREYQRSYPEGEVTAHVLGFTNIDDRGQEGLELAFDSWLRGEPGKMQVLKDRLGHIVAILKTQSLPEEGRNLTLSIDRRIQYLAYHELKKTVQKNKAESGSIVVLDVKTGEILAMVNQPSYDPNNRPVGHSSYYRNRAVTDTFEPGSTIKTFSIASALQSGRYLVNTKIDTNPGRFYVADNLITDDHQINHGVMTVTQILQKSSNIGTAKIILSLPPENLWNLLRKMGFGEQSGSGFPGEVSGNIIDLHALTVRPFVLATLSFGYAMSVTPLQLASAYATIANGGIKLPVTFIKSAEPNKKEQVISSKLAHDMLTMLRSILTTGGTGTRASIRGYTIAGKTGTARIAVKGGYGKDRHVLTFVGVAPTTDPCLVVAVVIRGSHEQDSGGLIAAPTFAAIMEGSLRFMGVPPDDIN
jgi:cell division protein FtsI (penicillin-binding protein 3)